MPRPFAEIRLPTLRSVIQPYSVDVVRESFSHEIMVFTYYSADFSAARITTDVPVLLSWGVHPKHREVFIGYVNHVGVDTDSSSRSRKELVEVVCVGATRVLRDKYSRSWGPTRLDLLAMKIAQSAQLEADVDGSVIPHASLMQHDQSNWAFLVQTAHADGMHISATGTRVHVWNLGARFAELLRVAPVFDRDRKGIFAFESLAGSSVPGSEASRKEAYGLVNGRLEAYASYPEIAQSIYGDLREPGRQTDVVQGNFGSAQEMLNHLEARRRDEGRIFKAKASLSSYPPLRAADVVVLLNNGSRYSGPWVVDKVSFGIRGQKLKMDVELSRESRSDSMLRPQVPFGATSLRRPVSARIAGHKWVPGGVL